MNRRIDQPRKMSFFIRFLIVAPILVLFSTNIGCSDDSDANDEQRQLSFENEQLATKLDALEERVLELEQQRLLISSENDQLKQQVAQMEAQLTTLNDTFEIVGKDTPNPNDDIVYVRATVDMGSNQMFVERASIRNLAAELVTMNESWTLDTDHVGELAVRQGNNERYLNGTDLLWVQNMETFLRLRLDDAGRTWLEDLTSDGIVTRHIDAGSGTFHLA